MLKKMVKIGEFEYTLDFFREIFQLADTYKKFSNIRNGVLEPTFTELNAVSDIHIEHEYIKEGRFFTKIHFKISSKQNDAKQCAVGVKKIARENLSSENKCDDRQQEVQDRLIKCGVSVKKAAFEDEVKSAGSTLETINRLSGFYDDGWVEKDCSFRILLNDVDCLCPCVDVHFCFFHDSVLSADT